MLSLIGSLAGIACVLWTLFEITRLALAQPPKMATGAFRPATDPSATSARPRHAARGPRFTAWDDCGNRIVVEDLGRA